MPAVKVSIWELLEKEDGWDDAPSLRCTASNGARHPGGVRAGGALWLPWSGVVANANCSGTVVVELAIKSPCLR